MTDRQSESRWIAVACGMRIVAVRLVIIVSGPTPSASYSEFLIMKNPRSYSKCVFVHVSASCPLKSEQSYPIRARRMSCLVCGGDSPRDAWAYIRSEIGHQTIKKSLFTAKPLLFLHPRRQHLSPCLSDTTSVYHLHRPGILKILEHT